MESVSNGDRNIDHDDAGDERIDGRVWDVAHKSMYIVAAAAATRGTGTIIDGSRSWWRR